jgi:hypothetical protein
MSLVVNLLRSLVLTTFLSFAMPIVLVGGMLMIVAAVGCVPGLTILGRIGSDRILEVLSILGSGYPVQGMLVVGLTWGTAGGLFELYNYYLYQNLRSH